ncbi:MAG TPA: hypothetical protein VF950_11815 [Planctomycetota bacterium]
MGQEIVYCSRCQTRIVGADFDKGEAFRVDEGTACAKCAMGLLSTAPLAIQKQILDQKKRALDKKLQPAPTPRRPMPAVAAPKPSRLPVAALAVMGLAVLLCAGLMLRSGGSPAPAPPAAPAGPSERDLAAQGALKVAVSYAKDHPAELDEQAKIFGKITREYAGTPAGAEAKRQLEQVERRREEAKAVELAAVLTRAREMAAKERYQEAVDLLEGARKSSPEAARPLNEKTKELTDAMAARFPALKERAVAARKSDAAAELQQVRDLVATWGSPRYKEELESALALAVPPIAAKKDGTLYLPVADAALRGSDKLRRTPGEWGATQSWHHVTDYVEWTAAPRAAGTYTIKLTYACPKVDNQGYKFGGDFAVAVAGGESKTFTVEHTAAWSEFKMITFGTLRLPATPCVITIRPVKVISSLMSLRNLQLVPAP